MDDTWVSKSGFEEIQRKYTPYMFFFIEKDPNEKVRVKLDSKGRESEMNQPEVEVEAEEQSKSTSQIKEIKEIGGEEEKAEQDDDFMIEIGDMLTQEKVIVDKPVVHTDTRDNEVEKQEEKQQVSKREEKKITREIRYLKRT